MLSVQGIWERATWIARRVGPMPVSEAGGRAWTAMRQTVWSTRRRWQSPPPRNVPPGDERWAVAAEPTVAELQALADQATRYVAGEYDLLGVHVVEPSPQWRTDPRTGIETSLRFGPSLDYRDHRRFGDTRAVWERSRHYHLAVLALAWHATGRDEFAACVESQLASWIRDDPFPLGVNWTSTLEAAMRLVSWTWIERLLRGSQAHGRLFGSDGLLWDSIYWHQWWISRTYSGGSSANNHLIGEMTGLFVASASWPYWPESASWRTKAAASLQRESLLQTFGSGLDREQAFGYHLYVFELLMLAGLEARRIGTPFSEDFRIRVVLMAEAIRDLTDPAGGLPTYGDSDEAVGVGFMAGPDRSAIGLTVARIGFGASVESAAGEDGGHAAAVLIGGLDADSHVAGPRPRRLDYPDAGLHMLCSEPGTDREVRVLFDAGPLGYLSIAAHGHADALSFTLSVGGHPVAVDPGTFAYHSDPGGRAYFRGTGAHNTILLDGLDQSVQGGPFLWTRHANARLLACERWPDGARIVAEHDGYMRLDDPVVHRRRVELNDRTFRVVDDLYGTGIHAAEFRVTLHPSVTSTISDGTCRLEWDAGSCLVRLDTDMNWRLERGAEAAGWYSPRFGHRVPTDTLVGTWNGSAPARFTQWVEVSA